MTEGKGGFDSPNHTQVPNELFEVYMRLMGDAELRVALAIIRKLKGWHKDQDEISISQIMELTGMSKQGVIDGTEKLVERGLVEKIEHAGKSSTYKLVVNDVDKSEELVNPVDKTCQPSRQAPVNPVGTQKKERKIKEKELALELEDLQTLTDKERQDLIDKYPVLDSCLTDDDWMAWLNEILPRNELLRIKARNSPVEDLRAVQHFNDEEVIRVVAEFHRLWRVPVPSSAKHDKSRVKDWSNGARQIISVCEGMDPIAVMIGFKEWRDKVDPNGDVQFPRPASLVNMLGAFIGNYKPPEVKDESIQRQLFGLE